jgi:hypothetical protein
MHITITENKPKLLTTPRKMKFAVKSRAFIMNSGEFLATGVSSQVKYTLFRQQMHTFSQPVFSW